MSILTINEPLVIDKMGHPISYEIDFGTKKAMTVWADKEFQDMHGDYPENPTRLTHDEGKRLAEDITKYFNNYPKMLSIIERLAKWLDDESKESTNAVIHIAEEAETLLTELNK